MKILTACDDKYRQKAAASKVSAEAKGFEFVTVDLGVYYQTEVMEDGWVSTGLFKPSVVRLAMEQYDEPIVWMDADAKMVKMPDFSSMDYDIGIAVRKEKKKVIFSRPGYRYGLYNAGFIIFNNTELSKKFIARWETLTKEKRNDQLALNILLSGDFPHFYNDKITIKQFPYTYNDEEATLETVIYHEKASKKTSAIKGLVLAALFIIQSAVCFATSPSTDRSQEEILNRVYNSSSTAIQVKLSPPISIDGGIASDLINGLDASLSGGDGGGGLFGASSGNGGNAVILGGDGYAINNGIGGNVIIRGGVGASKVSNDDGYISLQVFENFIYLSSDLGIAANTIITSSRTSDFGWTVKSAANQACTTTCTNAAVFGQDTGTGQIVGPSSALADLCVCAGSA